MNPEDLKTLINQLLQTGEILATKAFELAVKQVYVEAVQDFVTAFCLLLLFLSGILVYKKAKKAVHGDFLWDMEIIGVILFVLGAAFFWVPLTDGISKLINPEWYAVKLLLTTFLGN